jgi:hypothetical protein
LTRQIEELKVSVNKLQESVNRLREEGTTNREQIEGTDRNANIALWISLSIVLSVLGVLCLVFWPRKSKVASPNPTLSDRHKCPRCGWEHDPDDTVCRNPNCRTQF